VNGFLWVRAVLPRLVATRCPRERRKADYFQVPLSLVIVAGKVALSVPRIVL
jgi:hypothetical protein